MLPHSDTKTTVDELLALVEDRQEQYEVIHGQLLMSPPPTFSHQDVLSHLIFLIKSHFHQHGQTGKVTPEVGWYYDEWNYLVPDLSFYHDGDIAKLPDGPKSMTTQGITPRLVVEVLSESTRRRDLDTKKEIYEAAEIAEYWTIDPIEEAFTFFRIDTGQYVEFPTENGRYESITIEGFSLDTRKFWETL